MIRFRKWAEHNKSAIKDIIRTRTKRDVRVDAPVAMTKVLLVVKFDANFERFAATVGGEMVETYFLRAIQYAADRDGFLGSIRVPRDRFGAVVLSRQWHQCSRASGEKVYDALLSSGICVTCSDAEFEAELRRVIAVMSADKTKDKTGIMSPPPSPSPSPSPAPFPPSPLAGGESSPSEPEPQDDSEAESDEPGPPGKPLRPRVRERFAKMLDFACTHPASNLELPGDLALRRKFAAGEMTDDEIRATMDGRLKWVTKAKLARKATWTTDDREGYPEAPKPAPTPASTPKPIHPRCAAHNILDPCGPCRNAAAAAEAERKRAEGKSVLPSSAAEVIRRGLNLTGRGKPTDQPATTPKPEPPPGDAERRKLIREMFRNPPPSPGNSPPGDDRPSA